jgi:hypothetical protein
MPIKVWLDSVKGKDHSEDLGINRIDIKMYPRETEFLGVDCIHLARDT